MDPDWHSRERSQRFSRPTSAPTAGSTSPRSFDPTWGALPSTRPAEPSRQPERARRGGQAMAQQPPVSWEAPEEVRGPAPGLEYGGFGARFVAYLVDAFVVTIAIIVLSIVLGTVIALGAANNSGGVAAVGGILW